MAVEVSTGETEHEQQSFKNAGISWSEENVTELADTAIDNMSREDLVRLISMHSFALPQELSIVLLPLKSHECLRQLAYLAREACRYRQHAFG